MTPASRIVEAGSNKSKSLPLGRKSQCTTLHRRLPGIAHFYCGAERVNVDQGAGGHEWERRLLSTEPFVPRKESHKK